MWPSLSSSSVVAFVVKLLHSSLASVARELRHKVDASARRIPNAMLPISAAASAVHWRAMPSLAGCVRHRPLRREYMNACA